MTTVNLACVEGQSTLYINVPVSIATVTAENTVNITVKPGFAVDVLFSNAAAWTYRATTAVTTNDLPVAAGQPLTLRFYGNTTFFPLRQTADGTLYMTPIAVTKTLP